MAEVKYPDVKVHLSGEAGNAFFILGRCSKAMKRAGLSEDTRRQFQTEASAGDYDHLLQTCMKWFDCD